MDLFGNIRNKIRAIIIVLFVAIMLCMFAFMYIELKNVSDSISKDYSRYYASEIVNSINLRLKKEIALSVSTSKDSVITEWLKNEDDLLLKEQALKEIEGYLGSFEDNNIFIVASKSENFYYLEKDTADEDIVPRGVLSRKNEEDIWYYNTLDMVKNYDLNIDVDRFLNTIRVWINVKIVDNGKTVGVIGTGMYLDAFLDDMFDAYQDNGLKTIIFDEFGMIQIDSDLQKIKQNSFESFVDYDKSIYQYSKNNDFIKGVTGYLKNRNESSVLSIDYGVYDYVSLMPIADTNWNVATFFDSSQVFNVSKFYELITYTALFYIVLAVVIDLAVNKILVTPLQNLNKSIIEKGQLHMGEIYGVDRKDEFGNLAKTVQNMKTRLDSYSGTLEKQVRLRTDELNEIYFKIADNEQRLDRLFTNIPIGIFSLSKDMVFININKYFIELFKYEKSEELLSLLNEDPSTLFVNPEDLKKIKESLKNIDDITIEIEFLDKYGGQFWSEVRLYKVTDNYSTAINGYEGLIINIQDKKENEIQLMTLAIKDNLTGLYNRMYFDKELEKEVDRATRYGTSTSLVMYDLDKFKIVNDVYGHDMGDEVLKRVSGIVDANIRKSDIHARWGGEEFVILMPNTDVSGAATLAEKIRKIIEKDVHSTIGMITASFGVGEKVENETITEWFRRVDSALLEAKRKGRNRVVFSPEVFHTKSSGPIKWKDEYSSGNLLIDEEHKNIFAKMVSIYRISEAESDRNIEVEAVKQFIQEIKYHFSDEEDIMKKIKYEGVENHISSHKKIINQLDYLCTRLISGDIKLSTILSFIMYDIIMNHILAEDKKYYELL